MGNLWVAKDSDGEVYLWRRKPGREEKAWMGTDYICELDDCPAAKSLTWADEPIQVEIVGRQEFAILKGMVLEQKMKIAGMRCCVNCGHNPQTLSEACNPKSLCKKCSDNFKNWQPKQM